MSQITQKSKLDEDFDKSFKRFSRTKDFLCLVTQHLQIQLDETSLTELEKIRTIETRIRNVVNALSTLQIEKAYYERGMCVICNGVGDGITDGKTYCGYCGNNLM